uniref:Uncharacterized protein n=1 Tax=Desertifilum tharense IPPAS B-1220 TaxID=1781255 RepID=A0A1E5QK27_9CYAN|nr:hypothetical protein BH720_11235 [Desertifilum tharense IPPAS B-1220]
MLIAISLQQTNNPLMIIGKWEDGGKKGVGSWELGVGEEGSWELGVGSWGRRGWGDGEFVRKLAN